MRERELFMCTPMKKSKMNSQGYYHEMKNGYLFRQMQQEKMQHENL